MSNDELLQLAAEQFDAFITIDRSLSHQQEFSELSLLVILLESEDCRLDALRVLMPKALAALDTATPGQSIVIKS